MGFLFEKCTFAVLDEDTIKECDPFSCGHQDLDDFFHNDAPLYNAQLLGKDLRKDFWQAYMNCQILRDI